MRKSLEKRTDSQSALGLFVAAFFLYFLFFGGHYVMGDHFYRIAWAKAMIDHASADISSYAVGVHYSSWGIGQSLIHVPFILLARLIGTLAHRSCEGPINMLVYVINSAVAVALIYLVLVKHGVERSWARVGALLIGFCSIWFPYSKLEYGESLVTTSLLAMWLALPRYPLLAGLLGSAAITVRVETAVCIGITALAASLDRRAKWSVVLGVLPAVALVIWGNSIRGWAEFYHEPGATYPLLMGIYAILLSTGKSLFLFSPLLVLYPFSLRPALQKSETRSLASWSMGLLAAQLLFYANFWNFAGDDSWGERFLAPAVMVAQIVVISSFPLARRRLLYAFAALGLMLQLPPVLMGPHTTMMINHDHMPMKTDPPYNTKSHINLADTQYNPRYSQLTATAELLVFKLTGHSPVQPSPWDQGSTWSQSFSPPLNRDQIDWDFFWAHLGREKK